MGAFDTYEAQARCPGCAQIWWCSGQTKFFAPDFGVFHLRRFVPDAPQPLEFSPEALAGASMWEDEWWRVREEPRARDPSSSSLSLLLDFDELHRCTCGTPLAIVLRFRLTRTIAGGTATLLRIEMFDARDAVAGEVDFASGAFAITGAPFVGARIGQLAALPAAARVAWLDEALTRYFEAGQVVASPSPWTWVEAPARCEACGAIRQRTLWTAISHPCFDVSLLGPAWTGGVLTMSSVIPGPHPWLAEDRDRGFYLRARPPTGGARLLVLGEPERWGCSCAAGRASVLLEFSAAPDHVRLAAVRLPIIRSRAALETVDFVYAPHESRAPRDGGPRWIPSSRAEALEHLGARWRLTRGSRPQT